MSLSVVDQWCPLVSVIMPAYNAEKYIEEALRSVISQTYTNWELLVLNDCSTDRTVEIVEHFANADSRIHLLHNSPNIGVAKTRNRGFDLAQGIWIALLDSDDIWHCDKLEKQLAVAKTTEADIIYCSYSMMNENGRHLSDFIVPKTTSYNNMLKKSVLSCSTVLLHHSILNEHRFPTDCYHEDYAFWLELLRSGYKTAACPEVLTDYRVAKGSRSSNKFYSAINRWKIYRRVEKLPLYRSISVFTVYAVNGLRKMKEHKG